MPGYPALNGWDSEWEDTWNVNAAKAGMSKDITELQHWHFPILESWNTVRDSGIEPHYCSELAENHDARVEFLIGATFIGLIKPGREPKPQQLRLVDALAFGHGNFALLMPRRSSKSSTLFAVFLGRCIRREGHMAAMSLATTGLATRKRFLNDVIRPIETRWPDKQKRPVKIIKSAGSERIEFPNGSRFNALPPDEDTWRGDAWDSALIDEAGAADALQSEYLIAGVLPTLDTSEASQLIIAGTAPQFRVGQLLWEQLGNGREGLFGTGILEYSASHDLTPDDLKDEHTGAPSWELARPHVERSHPGVGTLTTLPKIEFNFANMTLDVFLREYLSVAPDIGGTRGIIDPELWLRAGRPDAELPSAPDHFALAIGVHPLQASAVITAAWRDEDGRGVLLVLEHHKGVKWLVPAALKVARKHRTPIHIDVFGPARVEAESLARKRPKPRVVEQKTHNVTTAAALLLKELREDNIVHFGQGPLDTAAALATKRKVGISSFAFGRADEADDVIALETAALALRAFDDLPVRESFTSVTAS